MSDSHPPVSEATAKPVPLFVIGCDRSGTTLLTSLMETGLDLAAPLETHFIPYFARCLFLWGDAGQSANRLRLMRTILEFSEILVARNYPEKESAALHPATLLAVREQAGSLATGARDFGGMVRGLFESYATFHGQTGWVDNSSFYESLPLALWQRHLPEMKVIHIVRDGRDVALSWMKSWWGPATLGEAAWLWQRHVADKRAWGRSHPGAYLELRYETLLSQPEETLERIAVFLGRELRKDPPPLSASLTARILSTGGTHDLLRGPVKADNQQKWPRSMGDEEQRLFEFTAGETLRNSGYPTRFAHFSPGDRLRLGLRLFVALRKKYLTRVFYAKKAKWWLPVALFLAGPWSPSLVRLLTGKKR
ncbi:MAG: sulfotransferase [Magnetococcales bacterium]|nr:sulfotransferase [Magnetococcales bacterium]